MQYLDLSNGDRVPALGLGTWLLAGDEARVVVQQAIETGYRHIDCARIYDNQADIGRALEMCMRRGDVVRDDLWVTSKLWNDAHAETDVLPALLVTLDDLQLEYLDLYLIHWPVVQQPGVVRPQSGKEFQTLDEVPLAETWAAMQQCQAAGLCRHIGVSNFSVPKIEALIRDSGVTPAFNQVESHPWLQQSSLLDYCRQTGIHLTAYSPLGSAGRPDTMKQDSELILLNDPSIVEMAGQLNISPAQLVLAWAINRGTLAIPKSSNPSRLADNLVAADIELPAQVMRKIAELDRNHRCVDGTFWEIEDSPYTVANLWDES